MEIFKRKLKVTPVLIWKELFSRPQKLSKSFNLESSVYYGKATFSAGRRRDGRTHGMLSTAPRPSRPRAPPKALCQAPASNLGFAPGSGDRPRSPARAELLTPHQRGCTSILPLLLLTNSTPAFVGSAVSLTFQLIQVHC